MNVTKVDKAMAEKSLTTAQRLRSTIKSARTIMRKDKGLNGDLDRLPMLTWLLFLKFLDDLELQRELESQLAGRKYVPLVDPPYRWRDWAVPASPTGDQLLDFINLEEVRSPFGSDSIPGLFAYLRNLASDDPRSRVISAVFTGVDNRMRNGYLLKDVMSLLDKVHFDSSEELHTLGMLYEGMLREMRDAAGDSGEFYTPRPVVKAMVDLVDPQIGESVLDPACGTGGFLVEAFKHLEQQVATVAQRNTLQDGSIQGCEAKPLPFLLCQMNLVLHGVEAPDIDPGNSLRFKLTEIGDKDRVDVILTNPPFGGEEERGIQDNFPPSMRTAETALLFLQLIMRKLRRTAGNRPARAAVIVPEGFLYQRDAAARIKGQLVRDFNLHTVVKLPWGTFAPYTDTPTSILFFETGEPTQTVWFYEVQPTGGRKRFTKTNPISAKDFAGLYSWWNQRTETDSAWAVDVDTIVAKDAEGAVTDVNLLQKNPRAVESSDLRDIAALVALQDESLGTISLLHEEFLQAVQACLPEPEATIALLRTAWESGVTRWAPAQYSAISGSIRRLAFESRVAPSDSGATLGSLAKFLNGRSYDAGTITEDGTPVIRISNMTDPTSPYLMISEEFPEEYMVQPGDLLASWSASFKTIIWPGPVGMLNQHIFKVTPEEGVSKEYLRHAIEYSYSDLKAKQVGMGMMHLRRGDFLGHQVPDLQGAEQDRLATALDALLDLGGRLDAGLDLIRGAVDGAVAAWLTRSPEGPDWATSP